ncbi:glutamine synthetase family protein [Acidithiobacillus ferridurans]|uniref:glutamine synthetase family protein n=1 Tax=Acidithiobacillus ferridurans TaxID=1232575 RepID=UPI001C078C6A|nr:glutamine synthetase family protein [Acidithiobacillus ferridurans]MBU2732629.1 glutamine synthetase [Acidithiobacillus ferridurans]
MSEKPIFPLPEGTHTIAMGLGDMNGIMRGKRFSASHWPSVCKSGNAMSIAVFAFDMTCDIWETPYVNFSNGYPDMHIFPLTQPVTVPWEPGVAFCLGCAEGVDHQPVPLDPREVLLKQVARAKAMGLEIICGTELEFYLLDPKTSLPIESGIQVYSLARAAENEYVLGPIRQFINEMGIPIEQSNPEYAAGQAEVNIRYTDAVTAADRVIMFRNLVKELAITKNLRATFMAKPFIEQSGNGFHVHYSVWKDGVNLFANHGKLSPMGKNFLAGVQTRMIEMTLAGSTTPNAMRRRQPYTFCPTAANWGYDNRTVGLRVIEGEESSVRIEKRDAAADCNPYYLLACDIAAGLDGIEQKLEPTSPCIGDGYEPGREGAGQLPTLLADAVTLAEHSEFMRKVFGDHRLNIWLQQARREIEFINNQVTQVELDRYIRNF